MVIWPEIFLTGNIHDGKPEIEIVADALSAFGLSISGFTPPEKFGIVMLECGQLLNMQPISPDLLMKRAKELTGK